MKTVFLVYFITTLSHALEQSSPLKPSVTTPFGEIEGVWSSIEDLPVKQFLGIPYAKPPVGSLRFLKPEPAEAWNNTLKATEQPPGCIQYTEGPFPWYDNMTGKSEDCLYLNVYTPYNATEGSNFAVMFWIYGGGLSLGSNRLELYDGSVLAGKENVIVVTINYRVGLFGFLTSNSSDAPGNMGLYDQLMALQWVNDNIEYFGGDKNAITIFGESAGSMSSSILCVSPLAKGMFSRAILESGTFVFFAHRGLDFNMIIGEQLAEAVNCATTEFTLYDHPSEVISCMRDVNATYLAESMYRRNPVWSFIPQEDDSLLPNNALENLRNGNFNHVPILTGNNQNEGSVFFSVSYPNELGFFGQMDLKFNKTYARSFLKDAFGYFPNPQKYIDYYLMDVPDDDYELIRKQVYDSFGDIIALCNVVYFAESYAKNGNDVYYYYLTHRPSNSVWADWMGVAHYDEIQFVFGRPIREPKEYNLDEISLSNQMMKIWANFAKEGHPGTIQSWPTYSRENQTYFILDVNDFGTLGTGPQMENCNFLRDYYGF